MSLHSTDIEIGVFASADYAAGVAKGATPRDVDWVTWAFPYEHVDPRPLLESLIPDFKPAFASDNYLVQKSAVAQGLGAMILERDRHPLAHAPELVELVDLDLGFELPLGEFHLVCAKSMQYVPRVKGVADLLIEQLE